MVKFKKSIALIVAISMLLPAQVMSADGVVTDDSQWELVWSDEFDGDSLNENNWAYETGSGYNNEAQYYTEDNVSVSEGTLKITAKKESVGGYKYTSGRLETITEDGDALFSTKYGRIEARIKLPEGEGLWPAFWMQPVADEYGSWPLSGEIDIMEARGRITNEVNGAIHFGETRPFNRQLNDTYTFSSDTDITDFHIYAIEWKENEIIWYVDGEEYFRASNWYTMSDDGVIAEYPAPFNKEFYIILNLAVGGDYDDNRLPYDEALPATMEVDYVRVYHNVNGYQETGITMPEGTRDEAASAIIPLYDNGNLLSDINFETINENIVNIQNIDITTHNWYFTTNKHIPGSAILTKNIYNGSTYVNIDITDAGSQVYAIQLIQQLPLAEGYVYKVKFDAMSPDGDRTIKVKAYGEQNYCSSYVASLTDKMQTYEFSFMMSEASDMDAMLQMNLGGNAGDLVIGNVSVIMINNATSTSVKEEIETPVEDSTRDTTVEESKEDVADDSSYETIEETTEESDKVTTEETIEESEETTTEEPIEDGTDNNSSKSSSGNSSGVKEFLNRFKNWLFNR